MRPTMPVSRRKARAGLASVMALALLAACTGDQTDGTPTPQPASTEPSPSPTTTTPEPSESPRPAKTPPVLEGAVRFDRTGGDVFAWEQDVSGVSECGPVTLTVNGTDVKGVRGDPEWEASIPLEPGRNVVVAACEDGTESAPLVLNELLEPRPTARIEVSLLENTVTLDASVSEPFAADGARIRSFTWHEDPDNPVGLGIASIGNDPVSDGPDTVEAPVPRKDGEYFVSVTVSDAKGRTDRAGTYFVVERGRARIPDFDTEHPSWIDSAVVYGAVHAIMGNGGARAVERKLEYLADLGVDALWLWPPVTTRALGQEYAIADYFTIDPEWGSEQDMHRLIERAHELGLRILLDFVPNHSSIDHRYAREAERLREQSHYFDFYDRNRAGEFTHYFDWEHLPNLNFDNPQVRTMITESFAHWVREFDVDGFRVDAAWGIKLRRPDYWKPWRDELKRIKPDLLLLAEATARQPYYFRNGFDVGYDWTDSPGQWSWGSSFDFPEATADLLLPSLEVEFDPDAVVLRFLNNNDTDVRFAIEHGVPATRVAAALQFTLPGMPLMFAGDEIGANYVPYTNLTPISWKDEVGLLPYYERLIALRDMPTFRSHEMRLVPLDVLNTIAYTRPGVEGDQPALVVLNFEDAPAQLTLPDRSDVREVIGGGFAIDLLADDVIRIPQSGKLRMDPTSALVLVPAPGIVAEPVFGGGA